MGNYVVLNIVWINQFFQRTIWTSPSKTTQFVTGIKINVTFQPVARVPGILRRKLRKWFFFLFRPRVYMRVCIVCFIPRAIIYCTYLTSVPRKYIICPARRGGTFAGYGNNHDGFKWKNTRKILYKREKLCRRVGVGGIKSVGNWQ